MSDPQTDEGVSQSPISNPQVAESRIYYLRGRLDGSDVEAICQKLLCDPITEKYEVRSTKYEISGQQSEVSRQPAPAIEILPKPGVMDPVAISAKKAIRELGYDVDEVKTGRRYVCRGVTGREELAQIAERTLANTLIEQIHYSGIGEPTSPPDPFLQSTPYQFEIRRVPICDADDEELMAISQRGHLFLNLEEMAAIREYYRRIAREPTDVELETLAQTWSEHCVHKTLKSEIHYRGAGFPTEIEVRSTKCEGRKGTGFIERVYDNLLADTIVKATTDLDKPWCLSVFEDNAGIIEFDDHHGVAFKVETHNHPSALEPYGGAATGIGGCIRDIIGCGLGAKPIANTDVFCFADPSLPYDRIPSGIFQPARSMREVVRGVRDYGNRMGIPTVNGAIAFDNRYLGNPLVYCGCVGLIPKDRIAKSARQGDRIVLIGGRTGRDGIHGATFSSASMTDTHVSEFAHAVQIGNAITEKKMLDVLLQARDHATGCLYRSITDCGAGGLSSAVGEMGKHLGAVVELEKVPLKYAGLSYDEIWISEAQERMVVAVPSENVGTLIELCRWEDVEATDIGLFTGDGKLVLRYQGQEVGVLDMDFLHNGLPARTRQATWQPSNAMETSRGLKPATHHNIDLRTRLLDQLSNPNIASKEWVIRQYDHEVQGGSVIKPLMGPGHGPSDGAVLRPLLNSRRGIAISCGLCPQFSDLDPYVMAVAAIDEAVRNNICVGGDMERMAILDNYCWGDIASESGLGELVRASQGCHDAALAYGIPFISGKDSLNNVFEIRSEEADRLGWPQTISIPGTLLISAISVIEDVTHCRTSDLKAVGNKVLLVCPRGRRIEDFATTARTVCSLLSKYEGVRSCHDVSEGGLLVAAAEMVMGSTFGLALDLTEFQSKEGSNIAELVFAERIGCYLIEVAPKVMNRIADYGDIHVIEVGTVSDAPRLLLKNTRTDEVSWDVSELREAWRSTFDW